MVFSWKVLVIIVGYCGVCLVDQGVGDGFVVVFVYVSDVVVCVLELYQVLLFLIVLCIGIYIGEVQLVDECIYVGVIMNLVVELWDLVYGGQIVMLGVIEDVVFGWFFMCVWLIGLRFMEGFLEGYNFFQL